MNLSTERYKTALCDSRKLRFPRQVCAPSPLQRVRCYTNDVDRILIEITAAFMSPHPKAGRFCLIALGGYGRGELCPFSDIDLLILYDEKPVPPHIAAAVRFFWDIGLTMGCVVRTIDECATILGQDTATDTAFLENRFLAGDPSLYHRLLRRAVEPYFAKKKYYLIRELRGILHGELYSPENTLYHVEPDIKNGLCTLRDCHRLLWAERLRVGLSAMEDLHSRSKFTVTQTRQFCADYEFLIGLRIALHCACGRRMDVLETALQPEIAQWHGLGNEGAGLLMEHFFKTVRGIKLFLLSYLEKAPAGASPWGSLRRRISAVEAATGIRMSEGIFFSAGKNAARPSDPVWIMTVFRQAMRYRASFSVELRNTIRQGIETLSVDDFKSPEVGGIFREILAFEGPVGHVFLLMHETGALSRIIPQFEDLTCKVEYDSYHEFTVDQHILMSLVASDELSRERDGIIGKVYRDCTGTMLLRLGLLLHDIGKALPGDHVVNGAIIAETVCERLGLDEDEVRRVRMLIYHHLDMSELTLHREPEAHLLARFAAVLEDRKNLDLLYLLTVLDIRSVGRNTWTSWKAYQLEQLYKSLRKRFDTPEGALSAQGAHEDAGMPSYERDTLAEDRQRHKKWLEGLAPFGIQIHCEGFHGFERLTVCGWDRMGFLRDIIGCISSEGYNILSAHIYSMPDEKVLDIFSVEPPRLPAIPDEKRVRNLYAKWNGIISGAASAEALIAERLRLYPLKQLRPKQRRAEPRVEVDTSSSPIATIIEIRAEDTFGLLHTIVQSLNKNRVNIRSAHLSTRVDRANDVFYVTDEKNDKITDAAKLQAITRDLGQALCAG
jgi:[protein-PII] uridylyltransferase